MKEWMLNTAAKLAVLIVGPSLVKRQRRLKEIQAEMDFMKPLMEAHRLRCLELIRAPFKDNAALDSEICQYNALIRRWEREVSKPLNEL